jgi:hypothetical protein
MMRTPSGQVITTPHLTVVDDKQYKRTKKIKEKRNEASR